jgi:hypothetical protein
MIYYQEYEEEEKKKKNSFSVEITMFPVSCVLVLGCDLLVFGKCGSSHLTFKFSIIRS